MPLTTAVPLLVHISCTKFNLHAWLRSQLFHNLVEIKFKNKWSRDQAAQTLLIFPALKVRYLLQYFNMCVVGCAEVPDYNIGCLSRSHTMKKQYKFGSILVQRPCIWMVLFSCVLFPFWFSTLWRHIRFLSLLQHNPDLNRHWQRY